jgi:hypothetical protein
VAEKQAIIKPIINSNTLFTVFELIIVAFYNRPSLSPALYFYDFVNTVFALIIIVL